MNKLDTRMSELMGWEIHEGIYGMLSRYFVRKDKNNVTGFSTNGADQDYYHWQPSKNIRQAIRVAEKVFHKYTLEKNSDGYVCVGYIKKQQFYEQPTSFRGESKKLTEAICYAAEKV